MISWQVEPDRQRGQWLHAPPPRRRLLLLSLCSPPASTSGGGYLHKRRDDEYDAITAVEGKGRRHVNSSNSTKKDNPWRVASSSSSGDRVDTYQLCLIRLQKDASEKEKGRDFYRVPTVYAWNEPDHSRSINSIESPYSANSSASHLPASNCLP
ncbi:hypothetical protein OPV22_014507 [Ensete ventricosum]|uniref:Uncharacterized protein n=1 Tax=Ensete ventricosum TaxID=4639 RepID=A0AAV8R675_ENSVE|nr:hypothetical protein OPV22_014507 [Ensete ventricosum]